MREHRGTIPRQAELTSGRPSGRWSQDRRLEFIDFRLRWDGKLNRGDLTGFFGISVPQASLDIAKYAELVPDNLIYDRSSKVYIATPSFQPVYASSDAGRYMNELLSQAAGLDENQNSFLAWAPPVAAVLSPKRTFRTDILVALLKAIREGTAVRVLYQSMTHPHPTVRLLTPHALAHDGFRWHARAYCHTRKQFRDFVIARILEVNGFEYAMSSPDDDKEWHNLVPLVLVAHPKLSESHKRAIELDFGMKNGQIEFQCRQAFLFYALRHLRLDLNDSSGPETQQIALKNRATVESLMPKIMKSG